MVGGGFDNYGLCGLAMVKPELSPLFATLTPQIAVKSALFCATLSKNRGGGRDLASDFGFWREWPIMVKAKRYQRIYERWWRGVLLWL